MVFPAADAAAKLLTRGELEALVGGTEMTELQSHTEQDPRSDGVEPENCRYRGLAGMTFTYVVAQAMAGNTNRAKEGPIAAQVIAVFADRNESAALLDRTRSDWASCPPGQAFTVGDQHWVAGEITDAADDRISSIVDNQDVPGGTCRHVMSRRANVTVETVACGKGDTTTQANAIADRLLAKFPG
ncbi:sensor domain-containing protein [Mycobacterium sp. NPDC003449]